MNSPRGTILKSPWGRALEQYERTLTAASRSSGTVRLHRHYLAQLREHHRSPWNVTTPQLRELLSNPAWSPETRKSARTVWRGFYRWAVLEGLTEHDPAAPLLPVKVPPGVPRPAPESVVEALLATPDPRLSLMFMLAAFTGLRVSEIARVHSRDLVGDVLYVFGKGGKLEGVPVVSNELLDRLLALDGWAFPNGYGSHLSAGHVTRLMSAAMPGGWTAHTLRHRCATIALEDTGNIYAVSRLLRHSRITTTERYARLPDAMVREAARAAATRPRAA